MLKLFRWPIMFMFAEEGAGGGGASSEPAPEVKAFQESIPLEIRKEANVGTFKSAADLAKSYVEAQRLIGQNRLPTPRDDWDEAKWDDFYTKLGRPETPDEYPDPDIPPFEGATIDPESIKAAKAQLHKLGLTPKQVKGVLNTYMENLNTSFAAVQSANQTAIEKAATALKQKWGNDYDHNIGLARSVVKTFGGDDLLATLQQAGLDNDPAMVEAFAAMGKAMMEDSAAGGGRNLITTDETQARSEIEQLKLDKNFMDAYLNREHTGHDAAVARMTGLMSTAFPGKNA